MKQEDKELLLKDLCARLPYGVVVAEFDEDCRRTSMAFPLVSLENDFSFYGNLKPYLFPLSSMTEKQEEEFNNLYYRYHDSAFVFNERFSYDRCSIKNIGFYPCYLQDWLNENNFDYRGLIPMGLALDATGLNVY